MLGVAVLALVLWAGTPVANKLAVATIDPLTVGLMRSVAAGLLAALIAVGLRLPFPRRPRDRLLLFVSGLTSFAVWPALLSVGLGLTSASHGGLIIAMIPVFTGIFVALLDRRWPAARWWLGSALALVGTTLLIVLQSGSDGSGASRLGDAIVLAGVMVCAVGYLAGGKLAPVIGARATTLWGLAATSLILLPVVALLAGRTIWSAVGGAEWLSLGYLALAGSLGAYLAWFWALGHGGIARISSLQLAQPAMTMVLAFVVIGERLTVPLLVAGCVIVAGTGLTQLRAGAGSRRVAGPGARSGKDAG